MIRFFNINDPLRIVGIFILLLIIVLPTLFMDLPLTQTELLWLTVGEKLNNGAVMYRDIWDNTGFLSVLVYKYLNVIFGKSYISYHVLSLFLIVFQAGYFNTIINRHNIIRDRTYVPALIYGVFACTFFDFTTLSPVLMGLTFLLPVLSTIFTQAKILNRDERIFDTGLFLGIASLFHFPLSVFLIFTLLAFVLYTGTRPRRYLLLISGFLFPFFLIGIYFFWFNGLEAFIRHFIFASLLASPKFYLNYQSILVVLTPLILVLLFSTLKMLTSTTFINYQVKVHKLMYLWVIFSVGSVFLGNNVTPYQFAILLPAISLLGGQYFLLIRRGFMKDVTFFFFSGLILWFSYGAIAESKSTAKLISLEHYVINKKQKIHGVKTLVLGADITAYYNNQLATPFLNWRLSKWYFKNPEDYYAMTVIYSNIEKESPEMIVDQEDVIPAIFERAPILAQKYTLSSQPGVYFKK